MTSNDPEERVAAPPAPASVPVPPGDAAAAPAPSRAAGPAPAPPGGGAGLPALRGHNTALVLGLLRTVGPAGVSRLELAAHTGLTPQAVSKILARLRADGLVAEAGRRASTGGKPPTVLRLVPGARYAIGLHLDRDELTAVLTDLAGRTVAARTAPLDFGAGASAVLDTVAGQLAALPDEARSPRVLGVGAACPGPLDHASGVLRRVTGFPDWDGFPLRAALAGRTGLPVVLDKDTNAAALGLAQREPGGRGSFGYLHLGTGLGAGLVLGGALYRGARTGAGEFGHQVLQLDGPRCGCGKRGCVEALCLDRAARGETAEAARILGVGAANLVELLDIDRVLLGGRTVLADPGTYVRGVAGALAEQARTRGDGVASATPVALAEGGAQAVADGAAHLVLAPLFGAPGAPFGGGAAAELR